MTYTKYMSKRNDRKSGNNRRPQSVKAADRAFNTAMMEIGRSNATSPIPAGNKPRNRAADKREWKAGI